MQNEFSMKNFLNVFHAVLTQYFDLVEEEAVNIELENFIKQANETIGVT